MASCGIQQDKIALVLDISIPTLHKYFRRELDIGAVEACEKVGQSLFDQAIGGNVAAAIFWMKARAGWREKQESEAQGVTIKVVGGLPSE